MSQEIFLPEKTHYKTVRFPITVTPEQAAGLQVISTLLTHLWNAALEHRDTVFRTCFVSVWNESARKGFKREWVRRPHVPKDIKPVTLFDQINELTEIRASDPTYASLSRSLEEEVLKTLDGSFKSFWELRKRGDWEARPPRQRDPQRFYALYFRASGYKVKDGRFMIRTGIPAIPEASFEVPRFIQDRLCNGIIKQAQIYQKKVGLHDRKEWWVSLNVEYPTPSVVDRRTVFVEIGTGSIGMMIDDRLTIWNQWQNGKHWDPRVEEVTKRLDTVTKGSRRWKRRYAAKRRMQDLAKNQRIQFQRTLARRIVDSGDIIVVGEREVRLHLAKSESGDAKMHRAVQNTGSLDRLTHFIKEAAAAAGKTVISINDYRAAPKPVGTMTSKDRDNRRGAAVHAVQEAYQGL